MDIPKYKSFNEMETFRVEAVIPNQLPDDYRQQEYWRLREELGRNLIDLLERFKSPCVVELFDLEVIRQNYLCGYGFDGDRIRLSMKVRPINVLKYDSLVFIKSTDNLGILPISKPLSLFHRLKWAFTGKAK
jgi:hypothetical protein